MFLALRAPAKCRCGPWTSAVRYGWPPVVGLDQPDQGDLGGHAPAPAQQGGAKEEPEAARPSLEIFLRGGRGTPEFLTGGVRLKIPMRICSFE